MTSAIQPIVDKWIAAERANDTHPLADTLANDFRFVGPAGFVLTKDQFVARFDGGDLETTSFDISGLEIREHDHAAAAIGVWSQQTSFKGRPNNGDFRLTMMFTGDGDGWQVLSAQLSPIIAPQPGVAT